MFYKNIFIVLYIFFNSSIACASSFKESFRSKLEKTIKIKMLESKILKDYVNNKEKVEQIFSIIYTTGSKNMAIYNTTIRLLLSKIENIKDLEERKDEFKKICQTKNSEATAKARMKKTTQRKKERESLEKLEKIISTVRKISGNDPLLEERITLDGIV